MQTPEQTSATPAPSIEKIEWTIWSDRHNGFLLPSPTANAHLWGPDLVRKGTVQAVGREEALSEWAALVAMAKPKAWVVQAHARDGGDLADMNSAGFAIFNLPQAFIEMVSARAALLHEAQILTVASKASPGFNPPLSLSMKFAAPQEYACFGGEYARGIWELALHGVECTISYQSEEGDCISTPISVSDLAVHYGLQGANDVEVFAQDADAMEKLQEAMQSCLVRPGLHPGDQDALKKGVLACRQFLVSQEHGHAQDRGAPAP